MLAGIAITNKDIPQSWWSSIRDAQIPHKSVFGRSDYKNYLSD
jgi:hypothetical protein